MVYLDIYTCLGRGTGGGRKQTRDRHRDPQGTFAPPLFTVLSSLNYELQGQGEDASPMA